MTPAAQGAAIARSAACIVSATCSAVYQTSVKHPTKGSKDAGRGEQQVRKENTVATLLGVKAERRKRGAQLASRLERWVEHVLSSSP